MSATSAAGVERVPFAGGLSISESVAVSVGAAGSGRWIHVSGVVPLDAAGVVLDGPMREQALAVFDGLEHALERAGARLTDIIKMTVFVTDLAALPAVNAVRGERLGDTPPASSAVQVGALYGGAQLEIEAVAFSTGAAGDTQVPTVEE
jgi:2-iminobutanoate/2-iminopropanoate deaminase